MLLVAALVAGGLAVRLSNTAQAQTRLAQSRRLASEAEQLAQTQPDVAILAGLQSLSLARGQSPEASAGLMSAMGPVTHSSRLLVGHTDEVYAVAFSSQRQLLATAGADGEVRLWDVATGRTHGPAMTGHTDLVYDVAFSPDGRQLATASSDLTARLCNPSSTSWVSVGCHLVNRNLSKAEWRQLLPEVRYERTCPDLPVGQGEPAGAPAARC